jgi:hypothetical protein
MNRLENPVAVLVAACAAWAAAVAAGAAMDVFARISPEAAAAVAILAIVFPPAVLALDESVRRYVAALPSRGVALPLAGVTVAVLALLALLLRRHGLEWESAVRGPFALLTFFLVPLWVGLAAEAARRAVPLRRSAPATSPAARRGAPRGARTSARGAGAAGA